MAAVPTGASRGPAGGRRPGGCLPSPWSSANAAIFQPVRVTSGTAGAGVGAGGGRAVPRPWGPTFRLGMAAGPTKGMGRPHTVAATPAGGGLPRRRGWEHLAVLVAAQRSLFACRSGGLEPLPCAHSRQVEC